MNIMIVKVQEQNKHLLPRTSKDNESLNDHPLPKRKARGASDRPRPQGIRIITVRLTGKVLMHGQSLIRKKDNQPRMLKRFNLSTYRLTANISNRSLWPRISLSTMSLSMAKLSNHLPNLAMRSSKRKQASTYSNSRKSDMPYISQEWRNWLSIGNYLGKRNAKMRKLPLLRRWPKVNRANILTNIGINRAINMTIRKVALLPKSSPPCPPKMVVKCQRLTLRCNSRLTKWPKPWWPKYTKRYSKRKCNINLHQPLWHLKLVVKMAQQVMAKSWAHSLCRSFTSNRTAATKNKLLPPKMQLKNKVSILWAPVSLNWQLEKDRLRSKSENQLVHRKSLKVTIQNWSKPKSKWEMSWQTKLLRIRSILAHQVKKIKSEKKREKSLYAAWKWNKNA